MSIALLMRPVCSISKEGQRSCRKSTRDLCEAQRSEREVELRLIIAMTSLAISIAGHGATTTPETLAKAYDIAQKAADLKRMCRLAGQLADAYLELGDVRTYNIWKTVEDKDCAEYEHKKRK